MSQQVKAEGNVFPLPVIHTESDPFLAYSNNLRNSKTPIVIDNGSFQCKAGWANESKPSLVFKNHIARHRGRKENETQVGNDIKNIEVIRWLLKTQFDKNVVTQFDVQEVILDYIFGHLRIDTEGCVEHPIVMTEAMCNPSYSRQLMSELLFECYQVPQVAYGIDSLFSYYCNKGFGKNENVLVVSCSANTTHVIPVLDGRIDVQNCKRINIGGTHMTGFLHRLLQLKYPAHMSAISLSRAECLLHKHCHFSTCYQEDIGKWTDELYYSREVHKIQLPFTPLPSAVSDTGVGKLEKCQAILLQVQALKIKRRAEKLALDEERLQELLSVQELLDDDDDDEAILALQELGYSSPHELQAGIKQLNCSIRKTKNAIANQHGDEIQESPLKNWCDEMDPSNFSDMELWVSALRQKRKELQDKRVKVSLERLKDKGHSGFGSSMIPDLSGGMLGFQEDMQNFNDFMFELEEKKERIEILDEILAEYNREFANSEHSFSFSLADYYQLHIGIERIRVPEILFQPSLIGNEQAGLAETLEMIFAQYTHEKQDLLAQNVFLTGGCASITNFKERIETEMLCMRPFQSLFNVYLADDPVFDSWKGAKLWAINGENMSRYSISRSEYEEKGADFFKEHPCSNYYVPPPVKKSIFGSDIVSPVIKTEPKTT